MAGVALYDPSVKPPQAFEPVEAVATALRALDTGAAAVIRPDGTTASNWPYLQSAADVHAHRLPATISDRAAVVRERMVTGGRRRNASGLAGVEIQIAFSVDADTDAPDTLLSALHDRTYQGLENASLSLSRSTALFGLRLYREPTGAVYDPARDRYASAATYIVLLNPVEA